jgi:hypothetical protein
VRLDAVLDCWSVPLVVAMLGVAAFQKYQLRLAGGGGTDISCCDISKGLLDLRGWDAYSVSS